MNKLYCESRFDKKYNIWIGILQEGEREVSIIKRNECADFIFYWELKQACVFSSSAYCEPIGNVAKGCIQKVIGRERKHARCEIMIIIRSHSSGSIQVIKNLIRGVADYLVDTDRGCVMSDNVVNEKRRKFANDGKVIVRLRDGKQTRYIIPFVLSANTVRYKIDIMHST